MRGRSASPFTVPLCDAPFLEKETQMETSTSLRFPFQLIQGTDGRWRSVHSPRWFRHRWEAARSALEIVKRTRDISAFEKFRLAYRRRDEVR